jgi:hypothetical protein
MVFVGAGIVAGPDVLDLVELDATRGTAFHVAELTLAMLVVAEEEPELPALGVIVAAMTVTVLASVALPG